MRLPIISPDRLSAEQKVLAADMKEGIAKSFQGFVNIRDDGCEHGAAELSYLIGLYCMVSVTLNTFDVPIPES